MAAKNRVQLKKFIRFQLSQMSAQNEHHLWESAAFELARQTISPNLLPATGPVQAGGDQGRDCESYRTYLTSQFGGRAWAGHGRADRLVFACTLDKNLPTKIKNDLEMIFGSGEKPAAVYYYAEQDLPVAKRHQLQAFCKDTYGATLEIFDGQAVADQLADATTFWIAEQFLSVPAEMFPALEGDEAYGALRDAWLQGSEPPSSYADFVDIKRGLRKAASGSDYRNDLGGWLALMRRIADGPVDAVLQRKALYEILLGQMKGRGNLHAEAAGVATFFDGLPPDAGSGELENAAVLAMVVMTAARTGALHASLETVGAWRDKVSAGLERALTASGENSSDRYVLLLSRAQMTLIGIFETRQLTNLGEAIVDWRAALQIAEQNPFCDFSHFSDMIDLLVADASAMPAFRDFVDQFDALVAKRDGAAAAGERSRDRAVKLMKAGRRLAAIDQLQRAKEEWFSAETMSGSVLAMVLLANAYGELHLPWAARYYASAAQWVALRAGDEHSTRLIARGAIQIAMSFIDAGEALSYVAALDSALRYHLALASDPNDLGRHQHIAASLTQVAKLRAALVGSEPEIAVKLDQLLERWPMSAEDRAGIVEASAKDPMSAIDVRRALSEELGQALTNDLGPQARLSWRALGVTWTILADAADRLLAEQLAAVLQIIQVDLAETDLLIVPSDVELQVERHAGTSLRLRPIANNYRTRWGVRLPAAFETDDSAQITMALTVAMTVLEQATALSQSDLNAIVEERMKRGLMNRAFWVAPSGVLLAHARSEAQTGLDLRALLPGDAFSPEPLQASELAWRDDLAATYSTALAEEYLGNRYRRLIPFGRTYLPTILQNPEAAASLRALHDEGLKDWALLSILFSIALQHEGETALGFKTGPNSSPDEERVFDERMKAAQAGHFEFFDPSVFTAETITIQRKIQLMANAQTWGLSLSARTPDFAAVEQLLNVRFGQAVDDIDHEDVFGW